MNKPKAIGTKAETAVARWLQSAGFPHAERRALRGIEDAGDITGCPGICVEVKGGEAARAASDAQIGAWLAETETERLNARAVIGLLVMQRRGVGPANAGRWWAIMPAAQLCDLAGSDMLGRFPEPAPVRMLLADVVAILRWAGYGQPLDEAVA
jgi:hypothetical protein